MKALAPLFLTLSVFGAVSAAAKDQAEASKEAAFVACLAHKEPAQIAKIRHADSQEAFVAAVTKGAELCDINTDGMSMGRLFKALNAHKAKENGASE